MEHRCLDIISHDDRIRTLDTLGNMMKGRLTRCECHDIPQTDTDVDVNSDTEIVGDIIFPDADNALPRVHIARPGPLPTKCFHFDAH